MRPPSAGYFIFAVLVFFAPPCAAQPEIVTERHALSIGDTSVDLVVHRSQRAGLSYVNLHDNENTAVESTLAVLGEHGGSLYELVHTGDRRVAFQVNDSSFTVDPNRIFTHRGIDLTLAREGYVSPGARDAVRSFADAILHRLETDSSLLVVTVHNNTEGAYSVLSYADGGELAADARFVHVGVVDDPDDFYFVTSEVLYEDLRATGSNVVLQDNDGVTDDGSLAVFAARKGIPYVNVEAQHGHFAEQQEMIARLYHITR